MTSADAPAAPAAEPLPPLLTVTIGHLAAEYDLLHSEGQAPAWSDLTPQQRQAIIDRAAASFNKHYVQLWIDETLAAAINPDQFR